jgi:hypothetical protein
LPGKIDRSLRRAQVGIKGLETQNIRVREPVSEIAHLLNADLRDVFKA